MNNIFSAASKTKYKVTGLNLENFLFKLTSGGVGLYKVKRTKNCISFSSGSTNHKFICQVAQEHGLQITVVNQVGLIKLIKTLPYCVGALFGVLYTIFCMHVFTRSIISVEYKFENNHSCTNGANCIFKENNLNEIKSFINKYISIGEPIEHSTRDIQNSVMAKFELLENCSITKTGCRVLIELTEAVGKTSNLPSKIIAKNNCIISSITTYSGVAKVKAGDVVSAGTVLVEAKGNVLPRANIVAKVWYVGTDIHNCNQTVLVETGNTTTSVSLKYNSKTLINGTTCDYKYYRAETSNKYITNLFLPIIKETIVYKELELKEQYIPFETVKQQVLLKSKQDALNKSSGSAIECTYSIVTDGDYIRVDCFLLAEEQIGTEI